MLSTSFIFGAIYALGVVFCVFSIHAARRVDRYCPGGRVFALQVVLDFYKVSFSDDFARRSLRLARTFGAFS